MNENENATSIGTETGENTPAPSGERTFSQMELDRIVQTRIAQDRSRRESEYTEKEQELARRELQLTAKERFMQEELPVALLPALNVADAESLESTIDLLKKHLGASPNQKAANQISPKPMFTQPFQPGRSAPRVDPIRTAMGLERKDG